MKEWMFSNEFIWYYSLTPTVHSYVLGLLKFKPFSERKISWGIEKGQLRSPLGLVCCKALLLDKIALKDQFIGSSHVKVL